MAPSAYAELGDGVFFSTAQGKQPRKAEPSAKGESMDTDGAKPVVDRQLLESAIDRTGGLPPRAYYHLVDLAERTSPELLRKYARLENEISLAHLYSEPARHRGELIYLKGRLRGLVRFDAPDDKLVNPGGATVLYQGDLFTTAFHPNPLSLSCRASGHYEHLAMTFRPCPPP